MSSGTTQLALSPCSCCSVAFCRSSDQSTVIVLVMESVHTVVLAVTQDCLLHNGK